MAKIDQSAEDIAAFASDFETIANNLRNTQAAMITEGLETIPIDIATAQGYIAWLTEWSESVKAAQRKVLVRKRGKTLRDKETSQPKRRGKSTPE